MSNRTSGTHFQGPLLGSSNAIKGLFDDVPLASADVVRSPYKVWIEDFSVQVADALFVDCGATVTNVGATASSEVITGADPYLLINPGTAVDSGTSIQWNIAPLTPAENTAGSPPLQSAGPITSTTTLMDNKELFFYARVGFKAATTAWDGKAVIGWIVTDTSLMAPTTGALTIATGGGFGFHVGEDGVLGYFCSQDAITAVDANTAIDISTLDAADTFQWYTLGARMRTIDASASTGQVDFFVNGKNVGTVLNANPMDATETFSFSTEILNGPVATDVDVDLAVDYVVTGRTRDGLTFPYDTGNY